MITKLIILNRAHSCNRPLRRSRVTWAGVRSDNRESGAERA